MSLILLFLCLIFLWFIFCPGVSAPSGFSWRGDGDGHGSAAAQHNNAAVPLHQMTASAVGNTPERDIDKLKEVLMRSVMHADERLFSFKVSL